MITDAMPQKNYNKEFGAEGEDLARAHLEQKGYKLRDSNFSTKWGELDLVMEDKNALVFVEVKSRRGSKYGQPEEAITRTKIQHMTQAAMFYIQRHNLHNKMIRFDVVTVEENGFQHFENAFDTGNNFYY